MIVPISNHCANLVNFLECSGDYYKWEDATEWLLLGGSIKSVCVDIIQHNSGFGYCSDADYYDLSKEELIEKFVTDLTRFNYVWGAVESFIKIIKPPTHPDKNKRGKIRDACYFIKNYASIKEPVLNINESIDEFLTASRACFGFEKVESRFSEVGEFGSIAIGLFCVYELRNSFAHGSLSFPSPDDEGRPVSEHSKMVTAATRIVLLSIQILLLAYYQDSDELISYQFSVEIDEAEFPFWLVLRACHLECEDDNGQLQVFNSLTSCSSGRGR